MNGDFPSASSHGHALAPGSRLQEFVIQRVLGSGGFGITYLARDGTLERRVVIKENLPAQFCWREPHSLTVRPRNNVGEDAENFRYSLESFAREAATLASLDHSGIVKVLRSFEAHGTAYLVMPFVEGTALDEVIRERFERRDFFSGEEVEPLLRKVLEALGYLHDRGIYHRDIKPGNILLTRGGEPVLIDFGAARQRLSERSLTVIESAGYTPFEQLQSRGRIGPWSDLYALGGTLYKMLTGETPAKAADRAFEDPSVPLGRRAELEGRYAVRLLESIDIAMAPRAENRFRDSAEWSGYLTQVADLQLFPMVEEHGARCSGSPGVPPPMLPDEHVQVEVESAESRMGKEAHQSPGVYGMRGIQTETLSILVLAGFCALVLVFYSQAGRKAAVPEGKKSETPPVGEAVVPVGEGRFGGEAYENGLGMVFRWCPAGEFLMGSSKEEQTMVEKSGADAADEIQHKVRLTQGYWMQEREVSQGDWKYIMGRSLREEVEAFLRSGSEVVENAGGYTGVEDGGYPMIYVDWEGARAYCEQLTERERLAGRLRRGWKYALPTESQWEYACRAGSAGAVYAGEMKILGENNAPVLDRIAWYAGNSALGYPGSGIFFRGNVVSSVGWKGMAYAGGACGPRRCGEKAANEWGLRDMVGNVWEWCEDWYGAYEVRGGGVSVDPLGPDAGVHRVSRGGSWFFSAADCRAANRDWNEPGNRDFNLGFRPALVLSR